MRNILIYELGHLI